jgi:WhiB family redox-sensing transcriptional regulator
VLPVTPDETSPCIKSAVTDVNLVYRRGKRFRSPWCGTPVPMSVAELIATVITTPDLPGAACMEHLDLFDACTSKAAGPYAYASAIEVCCQCPALPPCRRWVTGLPPRKRPVGVTAGIIRAGR